MPNGLAGTEDIMNFLVSEISSNTYVNIMPQYRPCGKASYNVKLSRTVTQEEFNSATENASKAGIHRFDSIY